MISFSTDKPRKKLVLDPKNLFSFSTAQNEKKLWIRLVKTSVEFVIALHIKNCFNFKEILVDKMPR
jgi:hypothetical protein